MKTWGNVTVVLRKWGEGEASVGMGSPSRECDLRRILSTRAKGQLYSRRYSTKSEGLR